MNADYQHLIAKLDGFIRKYYKDRLIRGGLYAAGLLVSVFLATALLEHLGRFGTGARFMLFWSAVGTMALIVVRFFILPLTKLFSLGPTISHDQAASIIGNHFPGIQDKLLNTLQLRHQADTSGSRSELIEAAIAQRSSELGPVPFSSAIDLRRNRRYLRYALPPLALLCLLLFSAPSIITDPASRILRHNTEFLPEPPFQFVILNDSLSVPEEQDFELLIELRGETVPAQVSLSSLGSSAPLIGLGGSRFKHRFRNVRDEVVFRLAADGYSSAEYRLRPLPDPIVLEVHAELRFPSYLEMEPERLSNVTDLTVPAGTFVHWEFRARSADRLTMQLGDSLLVAASVEASGTYNLSQQIFRSQPYGVAVSRNGLPGRDSLIHRLEVIPDLYPTIQAEQHHDSATIRLVHFTGEASDDHGLRKLFFHYRFISGGDSIPESLREGSVPLPVDARASRQRFYHTWSLSQLPLVPGDRIEHWFEVWDNDGVFGSKSARTPPLVFATPSLKEIAERQDARSESAKEKLREGIQEAQDLQRELDKLRRELLDKKEADWQDKQRLQQIVDRQKRLEQQIERATEEMRQNQLERQDLSPVDERLMEKQQRIQELFENVMSEEMKELYKKVEELMQKMDKELLQEQLREMKLGQEDVEKELDRALEMLKRMEVEQKAEDIAQRIEDLAKRQERLAEDTKDGARPQDELKREQEGLNEEFKDLREQLEQLEKKNEELEQPMDLPNTESQEQDIQDEQQRGSEQLEKKQNQKASGSQKSAAEKMQQLAFQMQATMQGGAQEQQEEDMDALRQLLENILHLSFEQESLMSDAGATNVRDPRWVQHGRVQRKLRDDARVVEDSLFALSKRVPQIQSIVNREMNAVNDNMDEARRLMGEARANERYKPLAADKQQRAMTSLNNLGLLLDEALQQMMQQMSAQSKPGSGSCKKPGKKPGGQGGQSMSKLKAQQQALQKQLEEMRKAQEHGKKPGEKPGNQNPGAMGMPGMSQQLAQMAAQQAAIRKEMQRLAQELNKDGSGAGNEMNKLAQQMEQQERDLVNKNITQETIRRQQEIMVRLLEHEKAEMERELDQKRTSNEGRPQLAQDRGVLFEQRQMKAREAEQLRTVPPGLKPYYRDRVSSYFGTFDRP